MRKEIAQLEQAGKRVRAHERARTAHARTRNEPRMLPSLDGSGAADISPIAKRPGTAPGRYESSGQDWVEDVTLQVEREHSMTSNDRDADNLNHNRGRGSC